MKIAEAQEHVDAWIKKYGIRYFSELTNLAVLVEEVGELARIMSRLYGEQSAKSGEILDLEDEMGDVFFVLICIANQTNINLGDALRRSLDKKTSRDKDRHINNEKL